MGKWTLSEISPEQNQLGNEITKNLFIMGKTQSWLAKQCGVSRQYISAIVKGKYKPSMEVTKKIADAFNLNVQELRKLVFKAS